MKILVTEMPQTPEECIFSVPVLLHREIKYVCQLRPYIPDEETARNYHKPKCLCKNCDRCECLEVLS